MTRACKVLIVVLVATLGVWGCSRKPASQANEADRIRGLEGKCAKLEDDYRAVAGARDILRRRAASLEEERDQLSKEADQLRKELALQQIVLKERDDLRREIHSRTTERDALRLRCDRLKKGLQELLGQDNAQLPTPAPSGPAGGKS